MTPEDRTLRTLDRYLLMEMARPLGAALLVMLTALLLERILRLVDLVAVHGGPLGPVLQMALNLIPHYLGLALPAAFFISIFVVVGRLASDAELDVMMACGQSLRRLEAPFVLVAVVLTVVSVVLYGFLQPYTRYAYRALFTLVTETGWSGEMPQGMFVDAGNGMTMFADAVDPAGLRMIHVVIHEQRGDTEIITTAERGELSLSAQHDTVSLMLHGGRQIRARGDNASAIDFDDLAFTRDFPLAALGFRPRGDDERELTLSELYDRIAQPEGWTPSAFIAEFHGRLVRAASVLFLPFFAVPMGLAAKRGRRGPGLAVAAGVLVLYHHALQFGESLVDLGRAGPLIALWGPFALFGLFCVAVTLRTDLRPGMGPLEGVLAAAEAASDALRRLIPARRRIP